MAVPARHRHCLESALCRRLKRIEHSLAAEKVKSAILSAAERSVEIQEAQLQLFAQRQQHDGYLRARGASVASTIASDALTTGNVQRSSGARARSARP